MSEKTKNVLCFICGKSRGRIKFFNKYTFARCSNNFKLRKVHKLEYSDCEFPSEITAEIGYHMDCYEAFNYMEEKYKSFPLHLKE